jgi:hypothetical protein
MRRRAVADEAVSHLGVATNATSIAASAAAGSAPSTIRMPDTSRSVRTAMTWAVRIVVCVIALAADDDWRAGLAQAAHPCRLLGAFHDGDVRARRQRGELASSRPRSAWCRFVRHAGVLTP